MKKEEKILERDIKVIDLRVPERVYSYGPGGDGIFSDGALLGGVTVTTPSGGSSSGTSPSGAPYSGGGQAGGGQPGNVDVSPPPTAENAVPVSVPQGTRGGIRVHGDEEEDAVQHWHECHEYGIANRPRGARRWMVLGPPRLLG
jgi:hypothetical protein